MNGQGKDKACEQSQNSRQKDMVIAFLIIEAALYIVFTGMDLFTQNRGTTVLKYSSILVCLLFSVLSLKNNGDRIVPLALVCTAMADLFLLVLNRYFLAGLFFFIVVQMLYLIRLYRKTRKLWLPVRIVCALLAVSLLFIVNMFSLLNLAAVLYFSLILVNVAVSWTVKAVKWRTFALGLSVFVLCDLCVGIFNLGVIMPERLYGFSQIGMWLFYLPSQVLIALSGLN